RGEVLRPDGSEAINDDQSCPIEDAEILGTEMARKILNSTPSNFFDWKS
ncbi:MAG: hydroxymethylbilane synthase, partial [Rhodobacteraceae bacterium]|nr:hydroxymethylbilane synthase [Paracoccaceae bacterium]